MFCIGVWHSGGGHGCKKGAKKVQIELEKKRNDDNLRSCRRSKSVRFLKSSTAA
jgi:hypothetical protein